MDHLQGPQTRHHERQGQCHRGLWFSNRSAFSDVTALLLGTLFAKVLIRPVTRRVRSVLMALPSQAPPGASVPLPDLRSLERPGHTGSAGHLLFWRHGHQFSPGTETTRLATIERGPSIVPSLKTDSLASGRTPDYLTSARFSQ